MSSIGGYFELETNDFGSIFHDNAIAVNSGRNALEYILLIKKYKKIFLPYYSCDATLKTIKKLNINYEFYYLNDFFLPKVKFVSENEALLYVNYFGIFNYNLEILKNKFSDLIVDNCQAFFVNPIENVPTFYSPRKFFGLPDGGFVYINSKNKLKLENDYSFDRINHLITRIEYGAEKGFESFKINDSKIDKLSLKKMSNLTTKLLKNINFFKFSQKRNANFKYIHNSLIHKNELSKYFKLNDLKGPLVYPMLIKNGSKLRKYLIDNKIFIPKYWENVANWVEKNSYEYYLAENLVAIPIDQRYSSNEMKFILNLIRDFQ